jgi:hypothetical protein
MRGALRLLASCQARPPLRGAVLFNFYFVNWTFA